MKRNQLANLIRLLIAGILFYFIFRQINLSELSLVIKKINWVYLFIPFLISFVNILLSSFKWILILREYQLHLPIKQAYRYNMIGVFFNNFLPTSVGGDFYKIISLRKVYDNSLGQIVSSIVLDRGFGFLTAVIMALFFSSFFIFQEELHSYIILSYGLLLLVSIVFLFIFLGRRRFTIKWNTKFNLLNRVINGINILMSLKSKKILLTAIAVSFLYNILIVISYLYIFRGVGQDISLGLLMYIIPLIIVVGVVPISFNSLGVTEGIGVFLLSYYGVGKEEALVAFLTGRLIAILFSLLGGIVFIFSKEKLHDLSSKDVFNE